MLDSSGRPKEAKSVSFTGGAGAEGDKVDLRGMDMGPREEDKDLVGAVEPNRRGFLELELCEGP